MARCCKKLCGLRLFHKLFNFKFFYYLLQNKYKKKSKFFSLLIKFFVYIKPLSYLE